MKWISLFSCSWIWELFLKEIWINIIYANELIPKRAELFSKIHPNTQMIVWDFLDESIYNKLVNEWIENNIDFLLATPPCQWVSLAWKNKNNNDMLNDERNFLILQVVRYIKEVKPNYVLIENVPRYLTLMLPHKWKLLKIKDILHDEFSNEYNIDINILNSKDFWVPQDRKRAIIKLYKKWLKWWNPKREKEITLEEAIWHLPSLESWEKSNIKWHYARNHLKEHIEWLKNTPTWKSAVENEFYYPKKSNWEKIKSYKASYARMSWDKPAPTITMRNDAISSQRNVHPWRLKKDWTYSDARVLTIHELMILSSLPIDWNIPKDTPDILIRQVIWESVPPLLTKKICEKIWKD